MPQRAYVRTSKPALRASLLVLAVMFIIGIVVITILAGDGDAGMGVVFFGFWLFIVAIMAGVVIHNLRTYDKNPASQIVEEILIPDAPAGPKAEAGENDFEAKLRQLESLKKDGLISDAEYAAKRAEIMARKW